MKSNPSLPRVGSSRRDFLKGFAFANITWPLLWALPARAEDQPRVNAKDPAAIAIGYIEDVSKIDASKEPLFKPNSRCSNCTYFHSAEAKGGDAPCTVFANQIVMGKGWCRAWSVKT